MRNKTSPPHFDVKIKDVKDSKIQITVSAEYELDLKWFISHQGGLESLAEETTLQEYVFARVCDALFDDSFSRLSAKRVTVQEFLASEEGKNAFLAYAEEYRLKKQAHRKQRNEERKKALKAELEDLEKE